MPVISYIGVVHVPNRTSTNKSTYIYLRLSSGIPATIFHVETTTETLGIDADGITSLLNNNQQDHIIKFDSPHPALNTGLIGDLMVSLKDIDDNLIASGSIPIVVLD